MDIENEKKSVGFFMKKNTFLIIILFVMIFNLSAEDMQLRGNHNGYEQFKSLSAEEQYNSIINSFKEYTDTRQVNFWVIRMINQYGREILPYMNKTLMNADLDHEEREPIDITLGLHYYIFSNLYNEGLLTEEEQQLYAIIIKGKIKEYILKYRVIDFSVVMGYRVMYEFGFEPDVDSGERFDIEGSLKEYYERTLGITGIIVGNLNEGPALDSPLAEYITD